MASFLSQSIKGVSLIRRFSILVSNKPIFNLLQSSNVFKSQLPISSTMFNSNRDFTTSTSLFARSESPLWYGDYEWHTGVSGVVRSSHIPGTDLQPALDRVTKPYVRETPYREWLSGVPYTGKRATTMTVDKFAMRGFYNTPHKSRSAGLEGNPMLRGIVTRVRSFC